MTSLDTTAPAPLGAPGMDQFELPDLPVFEFLLVKLASRCNIKCTYCYWFRDPAVYKKPPVLTVEAEDAMCRRLEDHIKRIRSRAVLHRLSRRRAAAVSEAPVPSSSSRS